MNSLHPGQTILHYRIVDKIGQGGMGEVYQAEDLKLGRLVAIKCLPVEATQNQQARHRFLREARSVSALNHPNIVTIHAIEETEGFDFIVMEYVAGETLRACATRGSLPLPQVIEVGAQVADALAAAHSIGLIHRDIKSANILITPRGQAKVLDFGLAKIVGPAPNAADTNAATMSGDLTGTGVIVGTVAYMSPEQTRGEPLDARSDIFSLGCVLYEAATGKLPFSGPSLMAIMHEIAVVDPPPPSAIRPNLPREFDQIIMRALAKDKEQRYSSAAEMAEALRGLREQTEERARRKESAGAEPRKFGARQLTLAAAVAAVIVVAVAVFFYWRSANLRWAKDSVPRVAELAQAENYFEAFDLATQILRYLPDEAAIARLMPTISDSLSVSSEPTGARVYLRRFAPDGASPPAPRQLIGTTPINNHRIARGHYILWLEKDGFAPLERTISGTIPTFGKDPLAIPPPLRIEVKLAETAKVPSRMVYVPGGEYGLVNWAKPIEARARLDAYLIDKFEVTNQEYKEFINAGGYLKNEFWKYPFVKDGRSLAWEEARRELRDRTGLPGPRSWSNQNFPEGKAGYPVTDITWYEAAAYAAFRGKQLPTVFQWEKAARNGVFHPGWNVLPWGIIKPGEGVDRHANFKGQGTMPVESYEFGMSPYGCYEMAGNVSEWCLNQKGAGFLTAGGSWADLAYAFGQYGAYPGFYSSSQLGFRCVRNLPASQGDQGAMAFKAEDDIPVYQPSSEADFKTWLTHYRYDKTELAAKVVEEIETEAWRREKITYAGADGEQAIAYLYLPKNFPKPYQVIHFLPASNVLSGLTSLPESMEIWLPTLIKSGRAAFGVAIKGFRERKWPANYTRPNQSTIEYRKQVVNWATDLRRGLDYLETRRDLDTGKLAFLGVSNGANLGLVMAAVETRYRSVALVASGLRPTARAWVAEANSINFAPHIRAPKLMLSGRYDENFPLKTQIEPLFKLLREPKKLVVFEGGHAPTMEVFAPTINGWLDETLGPVKRE